MVQRELSSKLIDLDIVLLDPSVQEGGVEERRFSAFDLPIDAVVYHPLHFVAVASESNLTLAWLRELRKLLFGRVLYDDGPASSTLSAIRSARLPRKWLGELFERLEFLWAEARSDNVYGYKFFQASELAIFLRMNSRIDTHYFKHKYLVEDAQRLVGSALPQILNRTTSGFIDDNRWPSTADAIARWLRTRGNLYEDITGLCRDLEFLITMGRARDSVLVARLALLRSICVQPDWTSRAPDKIRQAAAHAFIQGRPIEPDMHCLMNRLLSEIAALLGGDEP